MYKITFEKILAVFFGSVLGTFFFIIFNFSWVNMLMSLSWLSFSIGVLLLLQNTVRPDQVIYRRKFQKRMKKAKKERRKNE